MMQLRFKVEHENLHSVRVEARQDEFVSFLRTAWMTTAARIPANVMKLLTFSSGIRPANYLAESFTLGIHVNRG